MSEPQVPLSRPDPVLQAAMTEYQDQISISVGRAASYRAMLAQEQQKSAALDARVKQLEEEVAALRGD